ncbi:hypothetical protein FAM22278_00031 [Lacticaseibacillus paracasei]|nr:hypothetical protein FAM22278_00031 [Lacticaseibacillus paracasei]
MVLLLQGPYTEVSATANASKEGKAMDQTQKLNAPIRKHIFLIVAGVLLLLLAAAAGFDWQISQTIVI